MSRMNYGADRIIYAKPYYKIIGILFCIFCSAGYIYIPRIPIYTDRSLLLCVFFFSPLAISIIIFFLPFRPSHLVGGQVA